MKFQSGFMGGVNNIPLKYKFLIIYIMCVLLPIVGVNLIFLDRVTKNVKQREDMNMNISFERARTDIIRMIDGCVAVGNSVSIDADIYEVLDRDFKDTSEFFDFFSSTLRAKLERFMPVYNNISDITIYTNNQTIENGGNYYVIDDEVKNTNWYKQAVGTNDSLLFYTYWGRDFGKIYVGTRHLSIMRKLHSSGSNDKYEKILKIDLDTNKFYDIFDREQTYMNFFLVDDYGRIVFSTNGKTKKDFSLSYTLFNTIDLGKNVQKIEKALGEASYLKGWKLVGVVDGKKSLEDLQQSRYFIFSLAFISMLISTLLIVIMVRSYNFRIFKLSRQMKKVENQQFDLMTLNEGKDEIGGLIRSFNMMTSKINSLINDVYKLELQKKDFELERVRAELNFLQSQMNPHFLFNTLNAIMAVCVKNKYVELTNVIGYLSKTLRRLLTWKDDLVTIEEEMSFTEMYLKIEKFRFCDKFEYAIFIEEKALHCKIPKMSIQPLVENACNHGIQTIKTVGQINILVDIVEDRLTVTVEDNGKGMDSVRLDEILDNIGEKGYLNGSIGIRNVYRRLQLYYSNEIAFHIDSRLNEGTRVVFKVKYQL